LKEIIMDLTRLRHWATQAELGCHTDIQLGLN
jgi:hypothetical protein